MVKEETKTFYELSRDLMFKNQFGTKKNKKFTEDLLERFYNLPKGSLKDLKITNSVVLDAETVNSKTLTLDIMTELPDKTRVNLEMYRVFNDDKKIKSFMYISKDISNETLHGCEYKDIPKRVQINFVKAGSEELKKKYSKKKMFERYEIINTIGKGEEFVKEFLIIYVIYVDGIRNKEYNLGISNTFYDYIELIKAESEEELKEVAKKGKEMEENCMEALRFGKEGYVSDYFTVENCRKRELQKAKIDSYNDGRNEGKTERNVEIAKSMLGKNFDANTIMELTGLNKSQIKSLTLN